MKESTIEVTDVLMNVIYIRYKGSYVGFRKASRSMFNELFRYASENGLIEEGVTKVLTLYHDNPYITNDDHLRTSVAMTVPMDTIVHEHPTIGMLQIEGRYGIGHYELTQNDYGEAWRTIYNDWLFKSEYKSRDTFPFELYVDEPPRNRKETSKVDIYIPIE
ncbi:GyrI-like domain-containing protein [Erysipelothrix sp. HDW6C]|uniref:AraC family transcriptional regulator n=1 Tax=Erysipelothrix sp. HDW6C TaxID=2714930 RepID=UPI001408AF91|nr:GyrI-like domain-containing protein [Erysipelothrix sp. HDW6C]QIK69525.1 GyrI-like domain-containing protein [Erysipelothrix sp. HDW6C]